LTPKNVGITALNEMVPRQFPGEMPEFKSVADTMAVEKDMVVYRTEVIPRHYDHIWKQVSKKYLCKTKLSGHYFLMNEYVSW
jgi:hypothetical protein